MRTMSGASPRGGMKSMVRIDPLAVSNSRFQDQRVVSVPSGDDLERLDGRKQPPSVVGVSEQRCEARAGIEPREAAPVDRAVAADERCGLEITDEAVVLDALAWEMVAGRGLQSPVPPLDQACTG